MPNGFDVRGRALHDGELAAWLSEHSLGNRFALHVAGSDVALAIVAADGDGRYIDTASLTPDDQAALASWLADPGPPKAVHDAKATMQALASRGWTLRGVTSDTMLAAHLLAPEHRKSALNDLLIRHMRCALPAEAVAASDCSALILRTCAVLDLADVLDEELARIDSSSLLARIELPLQRVLANLEAVGIAVDGTQLSQLGDHGDLLDSIAPDGRVRATFDQVGTVTGELSSSRPNLHELGPEVRAAFVAGDGYVELMTAGYRDLDGGLKAHFSGAAGLVEEARRTGYAATVLGRRRYLPDLASADSQLRAMAERAAVATAIRGSVADICKVAMINIDQAVRAVGLKSRMVLQVDKELVFEVADGERDALADYVRDQMYSVHEIVVPLDITIGYGPSWAAAAAWD